MNYIYDVFINLNKVAYDFYEWNITDDITHVRKTPLFRVSSDLIDDIKNNVIEIDKQFLEKIYNKTEIFGSGSIERLNYCFIVSDSVEVFAIKVNSNGYVDLISKFLIDEEEEILEIAIELNEVLIDYTIVEQKEKTETLKTRLEKDLELYIWNQLKELEKDENYDKLKYLYYDCFNERENDRSLMLEKISKVLLENNHKLMYKIFDFLKLVLPSTDKGIDIELMNKN